MALICAMLAPPVVFVAGSSPVGQPPANDAFSSTVTSPPRCGGPAGSAGPAAPPPPPPPHAAMRRSAAVSSGAASVRRLTWDSPFGRRPAGEGGPPHGDRAHPGPAQPLASGDPGCREVSRDGRHVLPHRRIPWPVS